MRQTVLTGLAVVFLLGCEDGPTQTYKPSPEGAGDNWNDGKTGGSSDPSKQGFTGTLGGTSAQDLCDAPTKKAKWGAAFTKPITPPFGGAGIQMNGQAGETDIHGKMVPNTADSWIGLTVEQAEQINCQSANGGDYFGDGNQVNYWGDNGEVIFEYLVSTRKIVYMGFNPGYTGKMSFKSRDGMHTFEFNMNAQIKKDGQPYVISWDANPQTGLNVWANELTDALFFTYAPTLPAEPPPNGCRVDGHCIVGNFGDQGYMYLPAIGFAFRVANINAAQPTPSTTYYFDQYLEKVMGFSVADPLLKLDQEGPKAIATPLGPNNKTCTLKMGMTYQDLQDNCVRVANDKTADDREENKLLGGLTHNTERFHFNLTGVDVNFSDKTLKPDAVIGDKDLPSVDDVATQFRVDQATLGAIANDYVGNAKPYNSGNRDLHMTGLVYAEYARLVQSKINAYAKVNGGPMNFTPHPIGDPACLQGDPSLAAPGCTGFEGFVIPLDPAKIADPGMKSQAYYNLVTPSGDSSTACTTNPCTQTGKFTNLRRGLKPGHQSVYFCESPNKTNCLTVGDTMPTSFARVLNVFAGGSIAKLPPEMQDARFYFRQWSLAVFKYLMTENGSGTATAAQVAAAPLSEIDLFNDSIGAGQFETAEYIDRRFAGVNSQDLTDISMVADVRNGIMNDFTFSRDIFRGEEAIYTSMRENANDWPGKEQNALLTNVFGSPLTTAYWTDGATKSAYECASVKCGVNPWVVANCATQADRNTFIDCGGQLPPLDDDGDPLLDPDGKLVMSRYPGAFTSSGSIFKLGAFTPITVKQEYPNIQSVMMTFPQHSNPYDTASAPPGNGPASLDFLLDWDKKQPGIGFNIPINGQQNKFIMAYEAFLGGTTIGANIAYDYVDPKNPAKGIAFKSVETSDFLGDVFLCIDPADNTMLLARMYSPVASLLDWINKHSQAANDCGIIVRYSPYGNYPDFITSISNGVEVSITQGGGFGRVVSTDMFVPGQ